MVKNLKTRLEEDGYAVLRGLLNPATDLEPLKKSYSALIDELADIYSARTRSRPPENYPQMTIAARLCYLMAISHGKALHNLDPVISVMDKSYCWDRNLPSSQLPAMFDLIRHPAIIDAIEQCIGPEIYSAPLFHHSLKPTRQQMDYMGDLSTSLHGSKPEDLLIYFFFMGATDWHADSCVSLADARESNIINAWIPLTEASVENGCLLVVPGSHRMEFSHSPIPEDIKDMGIPIEAAPGDVVFMGHNTLHGSLENTTGNQYRWAFNTRYCTTGEPSGRPYLPGFIAHSLEEPSRVLKDATVWQQMWDIALENIASIQPVPSPQETNLAEAVAISRYWEEKAPDPEAWLKLNTN